MGENDNMNPRIKLPFGCYYLTGLKLKNVRTFRSDTFLTFCFPNGKVAQWTVLLGENGTGKTTILQHIAALKPETRVFAEGSGKARTYLASVGSGDKWYGWHSQNIPRPWEKSVEVDVELFLTRPSKSLSHVDYSTSLFSIGYSQTFEQDSARPIASRVWGITDPSIVNYFFFAGFGASRHVAGPNFPYLTRNESPEDWNQTSSLFRDDQPLISPDQWLLGLDHTSKTTGAGQDIAKRSLEKAKTCLVSVLPEISEVSIEIFSLQPIQNATLEVLFQTPFGKVPFGSLSLGYRTMAAWLIEFLRSMHQRYADLDAPETGPAVVLIDEFDLHMHPKWQTTVMDYLSEQFPNTQFIITTHSPLIVQAAGERANIALLRKVPRPDGKGEEIVIDNDPVHVRGWRVDQLLTSDLYGLDSTRSPKYQKLFARRLELAQKDTLSETDQAEFDSISKTLAKEAPPEAKGYKNGSRNSKKYLKKTNGAA